MFSGDTQVFTLRLSHPLKGGAWLRTNLGHAGTCRNEKIREVLYDDPPLGRDWFDIPMPIVDELTYRATIPLCEVGHFEAKCFFLKEGVADPLWPEGSNTIINVEPAGTCCANIIYNAFVRQFGPNQGGQGFAGPDEEKWIQNLDAKGYAVIPPSGTFRNLIRQLDFIIGELGCRIIQLLPINPTPTTYARMGRFGSPFAALGFTAVDPALADFDTRATPLEQFIELLDAVHERSGKIFIDIAINHTGWGAALHETNPEWLVRSEDGHIKVPGAWGVSWEDLTMLDYSKKDLWKYMADIFLTWCRRGVDGFRCDAGYMIPLNVWRFIISCVREQFPDTVFLLEGLGGKVTVTRELLNNGNFNWAYSELFQNYDRSQIENYLPGATGISREDGILVNFAETHDNNRLASRSKTYARMRTALCALCSSEGAYAFANGVEWFATEKIDVHGASSLNWGAGENLVGHLKRLSDILKHHPAFFDKTDLELIQKGDGNHIVLLRSNIPTGKKLLIAANLDDQKAATAAWETRNDLFKGKTCFDLITLRNIHLDYSGNGGSCLLGPGQVVCLSADEKDLEIIKAAPPKAFFEPEKITHQKLRAKALEVYSLYNGNKDIGEYDPDKGAGFLADNPIEFCRNLNPFGKESRVTLWSYPKDLKREVMIPPNHFLMIRSQTPFCALIVNRDRVVSREEGLPSSDGSFFTLFSPRRNHTGHHRLTLKLTVYGPGKTIHAEASVLFLTKAGDVGIKNSFNRRELVGNSISFLDTNGIGGMMHIPVSWGTLNSKYDALLAANTGSEYPADRLVLFSKCRAWVVFQGFSQDVCLDCLNSFLFDYKDGGLWQYHVPTGQGEHIFLNIKAGMKKGENSISIRFNRLSSGNRDRKLSDSKAVKLILRPDIEHRNFHYTTKAYLGPEKSWPGAVSARPDGFTFAPCGDFGLSVDLPEGCFVSEPEWKYMVHRPYDATRGLDPNSDLFSPGYFYAFLKGGEEVTLSASSFSLKEHKNSSQASVGKNRLISGENCSSQGIEEALRMALDHYIVKRGGYKSVIAGYPWFLDWGRDSLIFSRGMIAAGKLKEAEMVIKQFLQFEKDGTIPNMIAGSDAANRDTSDAPLWIFAACSDLIRAGGKTSLLNTKLNGRIVRKILISMAERFIEGTPNGIKMDSESGLIFSPAHFSWMDTNHPACTPREGYPVEIQALWHKTLLFLSEIDDSGRKSRWKGLAIKVQESVCSLYKAKDGYLSDCLYARPGVPAKKAEPDDSLRPNQLLAMTMGTVADFNLRRGILSACEELLVPGAVRSLADRKVFRPLAIKHNGVLLNDPYNPYRGKYSGDEDTGRKPAYHNGTAWTWLFPSFCEAWAETYGPSGKETAFSLLSSVSELISCGCTGHIPEILDGDYPHKPGGCDAQAWGASEALRVWIKLDRMHN
jgi:predicted glycogen debranching enzyme